MAAVLEQPAPALADRATQHLVVRTERHHDRAHVPKRPPATMECVTTAIVVTTLGLLGLGIVVNELLRLKKWLKNSPASEPVDDEAQEPPEET